MFRLKGSICSPLLFIIKVSLSLEQILVLRKAIDIRTTTTLELVPILLVFNVELRAHDMLYKQLKAIIKVLRRNIGVGLDIIIIKRISLIITRCLLISVVRKVLLEVLLLYIYRTKYKEERRLPEGVDVYT